MVWGSSLNTFPDTQASIFSLHSLHTVAGHGRVVPNPPTHQLDRREGNGPRMTIYEPSEALTACVYGDVTCNSSVRSNFHSAYRAFEGMHHHPGNMHQVRELTKQ